MNPEAPALDAHGPIHRPFLPFDPNPGPHAVFGRFHHVARLHAGRDAILSARGRTSYAALLARVRDAAQALADQPAGDPVAIALPTDERFPAAMLAALAAGRPYVPIDLAHPTERIEWILGHSGASTVLASRDIDPGLRSSIALGRRLLDIDALPPAPASWSPRGSTDDIAYILYTSGSTGRPKGVFQDQSGLWHDVMQYTHSIHLSHEDTSSLLYSPSVNGAIRDIFGSLLNGACLAMGNLRAEGLRETWQRMEQAHVTLFHAMPPVLRSLLQSAHGQSLPASVRLAYVAGDRFAHDDLQRLRNALPNDALIYTGIGSTECATLYRQWFIPNHWTPGADSIPVGYPVPDRDVLLLNEAGQPVPTGQPGDIHVRSRFIARGYWRDPALSRQAFGPESSDAIRTFRTGDRGRLLPEGLMVFEGRADRQVKVRGYRVEPAEIEAVLRSLPDVADAVVRPHGPPAAPSLVAVVEPKPGTCPTPAALLETVAASLPPHLVPNRVVVVPVLPRLPNFKPDPAGLDACIHDAMHGPEPRAATAATPHHPVPGEALDRVLAAWAHALGRPPTSIDEPWNHAGGDSLLALEMIVGLEQRTGTTLPTSVVTPTSTPRSIANVVRSTPPQADPSPPRPTVPGILFLVASATGFTAHDRILSDRIGATLRVERLRPTTLADELARVHSIEEAAAIHARAIVESVPSGTPIHLVGLSYGGRVAFELAVQLRRRGWDVPLVCITDIQPRGGYIALARIAWLNWCRQPEGAPWWIPMGRRAIAEARMAASRVIQFVAGRRWMPLLRLVVGAGLRVLGDGFAAGAKAAISQSQIAGWHPPCLEGELLLVVSHETAQAFPSLPRTLGWEAHADAVRVVRVPGNHWSYIRDPHGADLACTLTHEIRRAALRTR